MDTSKVIIMRRNCNKVVFKNYFKLAFTDKLSHFTFCREAIFRNINENIFHYHKISSIHKSNLPFWLKLLHLRKQQLAVSTSFPEQHVVLTNLRKWCLNLTSRKLLKPTQGMEMKINLSVLLKFKTILQSYWFNIIDIRIRR